MCRTSPPPTLIFFVKPLKFANMCPCKFTLPIEFCKNPDFCKYFSTPPNISGVDLSKNRRIGWLYPNNPCFISKNSQKMLLSVDYLVRWLDRAIWRKSNLSGMAPYPNFFSCTDLCSSLNRMGWWQTFPRFPTWTPRFQMICLTLSTTKYKSSHIVWKILL